MLFKLFVVGLCIILLLVYAPGVFLRNQQTRIMSAEQAVVKKEREIKREGARFVIHEHWATHHHFDLRLEIDGVLKSWAVPKNIPEQANEKRLAIETPDHALSYIDFEGEIEEGFYGAGTVSIWDSGEIAIVVKDDEKTSILSEMYKKGILDLEFFGKKMKGRYSLVRMKKKRREKQINWLLIKLKS